MGKIIDKNTDISTVIYCLVKLSVNENYNFTNVSLKKSQYLEELNKILLNFSYKTITKKELNRLGVLTTKISESV